MLGACPSNADSTPTNDLLASASFCVQKSSTYCREYASGFLGPAALHWPTACSPPNEGLLGQAPR